MKQHYGNYPLYCGLFLSFLLCVVAVFGPALAPHDPMVKIEPLAVDGVRYGPYPLRPLGPLTHPDYPLGVDLIGRDILSRLLWGVRPTLVLCIAVVATRIVVGVLLGGLAGWFGGRVAWLIDGLTTISLSVPLLAVSIAVLSALDISRGLGVFVVALTITAWCDTAALVKNRTQAVLHSPYIESARAIGQNSFGLFWRHVLPQLRPVLPVMIALELSSVTLLVAELGYLGFFIGGGYLYTYSIGNFDVNYVQTSGAPELGQMLSQFFQQLYRTPWVPVFTGIIVFLMLIAFSLLGEGLRRRLDVTRPRRLRRWWLPRTVQPHSAEA